MITAVMKEVRNTFSDGYVRRGEFEVKRGRIEISGDFAVGCHVYLVGKSGGTAVRLGRFDRGRQQGVFRVQGVEDGLYTAVYRLAVPKDFLDVVEQIKEFVKTTPRGGIISEQFGDYRYTLEGGSGGGWETVFSKPLNRYRKMLDDLLN